jgi:hypothetical protein
VEHPQTATSKRIPSQVIKLVPYLSIVLPFGVALYFVHLFGVNVFFADEWNFVSLVQKLDSGTLTIGDLFAHENEHIHFFPWVVMLLLGPLTTYNTILLMYVVQVCFLVTSLILLFAFRRDLRQHSPLYMLLFAPVPFLVFSFRHVENMLWGYQISYAFSQTFGVLALYLIHVSENKNSGKSTSLLSVLVLALFSATVASFSAVEGLLVWPAGVVQLMIAPIKRSTKKHLLGAWGLVGLGEWNFYFAGDAKINSGPSTLSYLLNHPAAGLDYFLTLLGGSLFWEAKLAFSGGLLLVCLVVTALVLLYKNGMLKYNSFWVALLLFSLLSAMAITGGRTGLSDQVWGKATSSRYAIFTILTVVSIYAVFVKLAWERRSQITAACLGVLLGIVLLSIPTSYLSGPAYGEGIKAHREEAAKILLDYKSQPDEALGKLGYRPKRIKPYIPFLERHAYNAFTERDTIQP